MWQATVIIYICDVIAPCLFGIEPIGMLKLLLEAQRIGQNQFFVSTLTCPETLGSRLVKTIDNSSLTPNLIASFTNEIEKNF